MCIIDLSLSFQVSPKQQNCSTYMCLTDYIIPSSIYMDSNDNDKTVVRNKHQMLCQEILCLDNLYAKGRKEVFPNSSPIFTFRHLLSQS